MAPPLIQLAQCFFLSILPSSFPFPSRLSASNDSRHLTTGVDGWIKVPLARLLPLQRTPKGKSSGAPEAGLASTVILHDAAGSRSTCSLVVSASDQTAASTPMCLAASADHPPAAGEAGIPLWCKSYQSISSCKQAAESHRTAMDIVPTDGNPSSCCVRNCRRSVMSGAAGHFGILHDNSMMLGAPLLDSRPGETCGSSPLIPLALRSMVISRFCLPEQIACDQQHDRMGLKRHCCRSPCVAA